MIHQQIAGKRRDPGLEGTLGRVKTAQGAIELQKDLLGQVLGVRRGAGKAVADAVNAAVLGADKLLPGGRIAEKAMHDQMTQPFLFRGTHRVERRRGHGLGRVGRP